MPEKVENRRVRMTKRMIKDALLELIEQQPLVSISITAVCETADVHRSTFYKYYTDIADLLNEIQQDVLNQIPVPEKGADKSQLLKKTTAFFDFVKQNEKTFRILFSDSAGSNFTAKLVELLYSEYIPLEVSSETDELTAQFIRLYIANGTVGMLRAWISSDFPVSSRKIAEMMYDMSTNVQR